MKKKWTPYSVVNSFGFAFSGFFKALKQERNVQIQLTVGITFTILALYFGLFSLLLAHLVMMTVVLGFELVNTAIEELCDFVEPNFNKQIKKIKDVMAGAVLLVSFVWMAILLVIIWNIFFKF